MATITAGHIAEVLDKPALQLVDPAAELRPTYKSAYEMICEHPHLRPWIINGLLRVGEIANLIAGSKSYKTYTCIGLGLCVASGCAWLTFETKPGAVLFIDNELHESTYSGRLKHVADAMGIDLRELGDRYCVWNLRGKARDIYALEKALSDIPSGKFSLLILDALYRFLPDGVSENDNAQLAQVYNCIDRIAARLGCAIICVHHASKGNQSAKSVTDIGAGAGSQSRACDSHIVLRPHAEAGAAVLDAVVRSFKPIEPIALRWQFPLWRPAVELDPSRLRAPNSRQGSAPKTPKPAPEPARAWTPADFAQEFAPETPSIKAEIIDAARAVGMSKSAAENLFSRAEAAGLIHRSREDGPAAKAKFSIQKPAELPVRAARAKSSLIRKAAKKPLSQKGRTQRTGSTHSTRATL